MTGVERSIKRAKVFRGGAVALTALNAFTLALNIAVGSLLVLFPAVLIIGLLVLIVMQTRTLGTLRRTQELNRHADQLEHPARALEDARRGPSCAHPDAEPVDLSTGERVAWVCANPECNAELPADWSPPAMAPAAMLALGGAGTLSAPMTGPGGRWRPVSELPEVQQATEDIPAPPLIEGMRQELEASVPRYALARSDRETGDHDAYAFTPDDVALMRSGANFGPDAVVTLPSGKTMTGAEVSQWIEQDQMQRWIETERWGQQ